jgi:hypothetical protein
MLRLTTVALFVFGTLWSVGALAAPGLSFNEKMSGKIALDGGGLKFSFKVSARVPDAAAWAADDDHPALLTGEAWIGKARIPIQGTLEIMADRVAPDGTRGHMLRYRFTQTARASARVAFDGMKWIPRGGELRLLDEMTTLTGTVEWELPGEPPASAPATLRFEWWKPWVLAPFLASFRPAGCEDLVEAVEVEAWFLRVFFGELFESRASASSSFGSWNPR